MRGGFVRHLDVWRGITASGANRATEHVRNSASKEKTGRRPKLKNGLGPEESRDCQARGFRAKRL